MSLGYACLLLTHGILACILTKDIDWNQYFSVLRFSLMIVVVLYKYYF